MAHDVFISHSSKDKATADAVCAMLESDGVRCWIAPRDVLPSMEYGEAIIEAIEQCRIMVLVFTANANASQQIRREVERAVSHGVAILPLRIEDVLPAKSLEFFISDVHWLDALTPPLEAHLKNLAGTIKIVLARSEPGAEAALAQKVGARENGGHSSAKGTPTTAGGRERASVPRTFWSVRAWTWAAGTASALLLCAVFVGVHFSSHPTPAASPGSAPASAPATPGPNGTGGTVPAAPGSSGVAKPGGSGPAAPQNLHANVVLNPGKDLGSGIGPFHFGMTPEQVNALLPNPFGNVASNPVASEFKTAEVQYFWVHTAEFISPGAQGTYFEPLTAFQPPCWNSGGSYVVFLFTSGRLFRISFRFATDCPNQVGRAQSFASSYAIQTPVGSSGTTLQRVLASDTIEVVANPNQHSSSVDIYRNGSPLPQ